MSALNLKVIVESRKDVFTEQVVEQAREASQVRLLQGHVPLVVSVCTTAGGLGRELNIEFRGRFSINSEWLPLIASKSGTLRTVEETALAVKDVYR